MLTEDCAELSSRGTGGSLLLKNLDGSLSDSMTHFPPFFVFSTFSFGFLFFTFR